MGGTVKFDRSSLEPFNAGGYQDMKLKGDGFETVYVSGFLQRDKVSREWSFGEDFSIKYSIRNPIMTKRVGFSPPFLFPIHSPIFKTSLACTLILQKRVTRTRTGRSERLRGEPFSISTPLSRFPTRSH